MTERLTKNQIELLSLVRRGSAVPGEGAIDFDQLLAELSWQPTKAAAHFSIRALTRRQLLAKQPELVLRRGRLRVAFELTQAGRAVFDPREAPPAPAKVRLPEIDLNELLGAIPEEEAVSHSEKQDLLPGLSGEEWVVE